MDETISGDAMRLGLMTSGTTFCVDSNVCGMTELNGDVWR
jgi:hypothetical protein